MLSLEDFHRCLHRHLGIAVMADERFAQEENHYKSIKQDQQPAHTNTHTHTEAKRMHCHLSHKVLFSLLIGCLSVNCKYAQLRCLAILEQKTDFLISFSFFFKDHTATSCYSDVHVVYVSLICYWKLDLL